MCACRRGRSLRGAAGKEVDGHGCMCRWLAEGLQLSGRRDMAAGIIEEQLAEERRKAVAQNGSGTQLGEGAYWNDPKTLYTHYLSLVDKWAMTFGRLGLASAILTKVIGYF